MRRHHVSDSWRKTTGRAADGTEAWCIARLTPRPRLVADDQVDARLQVAQLTAPSSRDVTPTASTTNTVFSTICSCVRNYKVEEKSSAHPLVLFILYWTIRLLSAHCTFPKWTILQLQQRLSTHILPVNHNYNITILMILLLTFPWTQHVQHTTSRLNKLYAIVYVDPITISHMTVLPDSSRSTYTNIHVLSLCHHGFLHSLMPSYVIPYVLH